MHLSASSRVMLLTLLTIAPHSHIHPLTGSASPSPACSASAAATAAPARAAPSAETRPGQHAPAAPPACASPHSTGSAWLTAKSKTTRTASGCNPSMQLMQPSPRQQPPLLMLLPLPRSRSRQQPASLQMPTLLHLPRSLPGPVQCSPPSQQQQQQKSQSRLLRRHLARLALWLGLCCRVLLRPRRSPGLRPGRCGPGAGLPATTSPECVLEQCGGGLHL